MKKKVKFQKYKNLIFSTNSDHFVLNIKGPSLEIKTHFEKTNTQDYTDYTIMSPNMKLLTHQEPSRIDSYKISSIKDVSIWAT